MLSSSAMDGSLTAEEREGAELALVAHKELCNPKGSRFFTTHKNAFMARALLGHVKNFLDGRQLVRANVKGEKAPENRLEKSVREATASDVVKHELRAHTVMYHTIFGPALALVGHVQDLQGVADVVRAIEAFLLRMLNEKGLIEDLIEDGGEQPRTFIDGTHLERRLTGLSKASAAIRVLCHKLNAPLDNTEVVNNLKIQAAQMLKVNRSMSGDALTNKTSSLPSFCTLPSVVTWIQACNSTGYRTQINVASRADNIPNESTFAYEDAMLDRNKNFNVERINGILMYKKNGTGKFLEGLTEEQRDRAMEVCTQTRATQALLKSSKEQTEEMMVALQRKQREGALAAAEALKKQQELRMLFTNMAIIPTVDTLAAFLQAKSGQATEKKERIKQVFRHYNQWEGEAGLAKGAVNAFKPKGDAVPAWEASLTALVSSPEAATIRAAQAKAPAELPTAAHGGGQPPLNPAALSPSLHPLVRIAYSKVVREALPPRRRQGGWGALRRETPAPKRRERQRREVGAGDRGPRRRGR